MRLRITMLAVVLTGLVNGCVDQGPRRQPMPYAVSTDVASNVSRLMAAGLRDEGMRAKVRDYLRASRFSFHKASLNEFMATPDGKLLREAAAKATNTGRDSLARLLANLPPMDLIMPSAKHRRTWAATADLVVGTTADNDSVPVILVAMNGTERLRRQMKVVDEPYLLIEPTETHSERVNAAPYRPGNTIADADDGLPGGFIERVGRNGKVIQHVELAALYKKRSGLSRATASVAPHDTTYLDEFESIGPADGDGTFEYMFFTHIYDEYGNDVGFYRTSREYYYDVDPDISGYQSEGIQYSNLPILFETLVDSVGSPHRLYFEIYEDDPVFDDYAGATNVYWTDNGQWLDVDEDQWHSNAKISWTHRYSSGSGSTAGDLITLHGPSMIPQGGSCGQWTVSSNSYIDAYEWRVNGDPTSNSATFNYNPSSSFDLEVAVWGGNHKVGTASMSVEVTAPGECWVERTAKKPNMSAAAKRP